MSSAENGRLVFWITDEEWLKIHAVLSLSTHPDVAMVHEFFAERRLAAPADVEETVRETLNGYLTMADAYPAAEEVLCALRFYDGVPQRPTPRDETPA